MATIPSISASFIGRVLADRYRLDSVLGSGGMGAVYQARDLQTDATLAIKLLHQLDQGADDHHQRFFDEALIIGQLFHPNIVQVIGFDKDKDGRPFLIMELLRGKDLYDVLEERKKLPLEKTLEIVRQVGSALHAAHTLGVAHRDIKPSRSAVGGVSREELLGIGCGRFADRAGNAPIGMNKDCSEPFDRGGDRGNIGLHF
jgi:serine/threonine protein kinase